jgi:hypothetical protein
MLKREPAGGRGPLALIFCLRVLLSHRYVFGGIFLEEVLIFFFVSERLNQSFITSANGSDRHTFGKKWELSGGR